MVPHPLREQREDRLVIGKLDPDSLAADAGREPRLEEAGSRSSKYHLDSAVSGLRTPRHRMRNHFDNLLIFGMIQQHIK